MVDQFRQITGNCSSIENKPINIEGKVSDLQLFDVSVPDLFIKVHFEFRVSSISRFHSDYHLWFSPSIVFLFNSLLCNDTYWFLTIRQVVLYKILFLIESTLWFTNGSTQWILCKFISCEITAYIFPNLGSGIKKFLRFEMIKLLEKSVDICKNENEGMIKWVGKVAKFRV